MNFKQFLKHTSCALLFVGAAAGCASSDKKNNDDVPVGQTVVAECAFTDSTRNIDVINAVYDKFVFAIDCAGDEIGSPEKYFTANALKKLQEDYTFDCEEGPCYAYYALRTEAQDSKPGSDGASRICNIEPLGDGWYIVSYSDMGWPGQTRIRIIDNKIDRYERIAM